MTRLLSLLSFMIFVTADAQSLCRVVNAASGEVGVPSGGALATAFCTGLSDIVKPGVFMAAPSEPLPFILNGVMVLINNSPAPLLALYVPFVDDGGETQIQYQVPLARNSTAGPIGVPDNGTFNIWVVNSKGGVIFNNSATSLAPAGRGGFFSDDNGNATALHASDGSAVTVDNPAHPGETIIVYADDFFQVWPPPPMGLPVPEQPTFQFDARLPNFYFLFNDLYLQDYPIFDIRRGSVPSTQPIPVLFRGLAVGQIGVEEIHFMVPEDQAPGDWALFFNTNHISSPYAKVPVR